MVAPGLGVVAGGVGREEQRRVLQSFGGSTGRATGGAGPPTTVQTRLADEIMAAPPIPG